MGFLDYIFQATGLQPREMLSPLAKSQDWMEGNAYIPPEVQGRVTALNEVAQQAQKPPKNKYNKNTPDWVKPLVDKAANQYGVPTAMLTTQQFKESSFRPTVKSPAGAVGISQFMPATARAYGLRVDDKVDERLIPEKAIMAQAKLMADLKNRHGSWEKALSAYNSGQPEAYLDPTFGKGETYNYVRDIMSQLK